MFRNRKFGAGDGVKKNNQKVNIFNKSYEFYDIIFPYESKL